MAHETLPITGLELDVVPPSVLVCGDPERATKTAAQLDAAALLSEQREYRAYGGTYEGMSVLVCSHGVGAPGAAVAFEELIAAGARRLLRIGTCGSLQPHIHDGDLVVATAAVDATGYGRLTAPPGYPAVADVTLTYTLLRTAAAGERRSYSGLVLSSDSFYRGVATPYTPHYPTLSQANVLAVEMECAALFHVGNLRRVPAGAILAVDGNVLETGETIDAYDPHRPIVEAAVTDEIQIALRVLKEMETRDW